MIKQFSKKIKSNDLQFSSSLPPIKKIDCPIIIIPGFMESCLTTTSKYNVWPTTLPLALNKLSIENTLNASGLVNSNYSNLFKFLKSIGYSEGKTLFVFPYDWRKSVEKIGHQLNNYIKHLQHNYGFKSVDIINHSMGGLVTRKAHKLGAAISKAIYIVSPHYGMHTAYLMTNKSLSKKYVISWLTKSLGNTYKLKIIGLYAAGTLKLAKKVEDIVSNFPSSYDLLPDKFYFQNQPLVNNIETMEETYFGENGNEGPWNFSESQQDEVKRSMRFKEQLGKDLPGNQNLLIYSQNQVTKDRILWESDSVLSKYALVESNAKGDDTIGKKSQMLEGGNPNGLRAEVKGIHSEVQNNSETHYAIYKFLNLNN